MAESGEQRAFSEDEEVRAAPAVPSEARVLMVYCVRDGA